MNLKKAKKVAYEMSKNLGGEHLEALEILGKYLEEISRIIKQKHHNATDYGPKEFYDHSVISDLWEAWPQEDGK